jgi:retron-type reverse transcriptase
MDKIDLSLKEGFRVKPCALNAEFQHFILRFNKISSLYG